MVTNIVRSTPLMAPLGVGYVVGSVALLINDVADPGPLSPEAERVAARQRAFIELGTDQHPRAAAAAATRARHISTEQYLWGLHRLLDGVTTVAKHPPRRTDARAT